MEVRESKEDTGVGQEVRGQGGPGGSQWEASGAELDHPGQALVWTTAKALLGSGFASKTRRDWWEGQGASHGTQGWPRKPMQPRKP